MIVVRALVFCSRACLCKFCVPHITSNDRRGHRRPHSPNINTATNGTPAKNTFIVLHFWSARTRTTQQRHTDPILSGLTRARACSTPPLTIYPDCERQHTALVSTQTAYGCGFLASSPPISSAHKLRETRPLVRARVCCSRTKPHTHVARSLCGALARWRASLLITVYHI